MTKHEVPDEELSPLACALRRMRKDTGLALREFAEAAGLGSGYAHYESRNFKQKEIKIDPREQIIAALLARGIAKERVAILGPVTGVDPKELELKRLREQLDAITTHLGLPQSSPATVKSAKKAHGQKPTRRPGRKRGNKTSLGQKAG